MAQVGRRSTIYGEASGPDGRGLPMSIDALAMPNDKAGMPPERLDALLQGLVKVLDDGASLINTSGGTLERLMKHLNRELNKQINKLEEEYEAQQDMQPGEVVRGLAPQLAETMDMANKVTMILDRLNKMATNTAKALDQGVRLRTFIATGDEVDHGLEGLSENALRRMINLTAQGETIPAEQRGTPRIDQIPTIEVVANVDRPPSQRDETA